MVLKNKKIIILCSILSLSIILSLFYLISTPKILNKKETEIFLEKLLSKERYGDKGFFYTYNLQDNVISIKKGIRFWDIKRYRLSKSKYKFLLLKEENNSNFKYKKDNIEFNLRSCNAGSFVLLINGKIMENKCYKYFLMKNKKHEEIELL